MGCLRVAVKDLYHDSGHLRMKVSIVCSVAQNTTLIGLLDKHGRILYDSKGRKLVIRK